MGIILKKLMMEFEKLKIDGLVYVNQKSLRIKGDFLLKLLEKIYWKILYLKN